MIKRGSSYAISLIGLVPPEPVHEPQAPPVVLSITPDCELLVIVVIVELSIEILPSLTLSERSINIELG